MKFEKYSTKATRHQFWFTEFSSYLDLIKQGYTPDEIKEKNSKENLFCASSLNRSKVIMTAIRQRTEGLGNDFIDIFFDSDIETQKFLCLLTCLKSDRLMAECAYEIIRPQIINQYFYFTRSDIIRFFDFKALLNQTIGSWKPSNLDSLRSSYLSMFKEARIIKEKEKNIFAITPLRASEEAKKWIKDNDYGLLYEALTGETP